MKKHTLHHAILLGSAAVSAGMAFPALAQETSSFQLEEIVVTARRREERLQDVPVSMTVLSQQQLANANVSNSSDIALYTPSLTTNKRFGDDLATFVIRGFTQEMRTTSSVGVYFADVVSPRGATTQASGDGAGPGLFFDLENVQVLKGPQGTLFGRNTTGGAVLLVPKKPIEEFEGYVEASLGNFDLQQTQAMINIPVNDSIRLRLGMDQKKRDGYLNNVGSAGPDAFGDLDYIAGRASLVVDITDDLENYTVFNYSDSSNNGTFPVTTHCNPSSLGGGAFGGFLGDMCQAQLDRQAAAGNTDFWDTAQSLPNPRSEIEEWRLINTTTWEVSDALTVKNIVSYARLKTINNSPMWGTDFQFQPFMAAPGATIPYRFAAAGASSDGMKSTNTSTFVEELQFQGVAFDDRLTWQAGLYYEKTEPEGLMGTASPANIACDFASLESPNRADWRCNDVFAGLTVLDLVNAGMLPPDAYGNEAAYLGMPIRVGSIQHSVEQLEFTNKAVYAQGSWELTDRLSMTLGVRYTDDETSGSQQISLIRFPYDPLFGTLSAPVGIDLPPLVSGTQKSEEPTWQLGFEYRPVDDTMVYAKYVRGYRQGSINVASQPELAAFGPEQVDTYEVGLKTAFGDEVRGTFNAAIFYNDFQDQQLQANLVLSPEYGSVGSSAIVNAGKSVIQGLEMDGSLEFGDLILTAAYTYLDTEVKEIEDYTAIIAATGATPAGMSAFKGDPLVFSPEHSLVASANYRAPLPAGLGDMILGATYVYTDEMNSVSSQFFSPLGVLPSYELVNLHMNWNRVGGSAVDLSVFVNNLLEEEYYTFATGNFSVLESENGIPGQPRMFGVRLRYNFGALGL